MASFSLFENLYNYFSGQKLILYLATLGVAAVSIVALSQIEVREDIRSMLPDDRSEAAKDFELLQKAPLSRKVIVNLSGASETSPEELTAAADRLAESMNPPFFSHAITGPKVPAGQDFFSWLMNAQPNLATLEDMDRVRLHLTSKKVRESLKDVYSGLLGPEGAVMKRLFEADPLGLRFIVLEKLRFLNPVSEMRLTGNHFLSADGKHALIIADTPVEITDYGNASKMLDHFRKLATSVVPAEVGVALLSGHRYTVANTDSIKRDVSLVLACSSVALVIIFLFFLRTLGGLFVFLVPVFALSIAAAGVSLFGRAVSAITIGFGAVLLGVSVDFALHVYFALTHERGNPCRSVARVSRPVLFGGLTTLGAFGVLLLSRLPGQRELAIFSIVGISTSLVLSLAVLPHLIRSGNRANGFRMSFAGNRCHLGRHWIIGGWLTLMALCAWQGTKLRFDGSLRSLNLVPDEIIAAESQVRENWGDFRGNAMIFAEGSDLQSALETNERLFECLSRRSSAKGVVSLAPVLPSAATQRSNQLRWNEFWTDERRELTRRLLEKEGATLGFVPGAFSPFLERSPAPSMELTSNDLRAIGLREVVDSMIIHENGRVGVLTLVPDTPSMADLVAQGECKASGTRFVSQNRFGRIISKEIGHDFLKFVVRAALLVCLLLGLLFRNLKKVLLAMVPVVTGTLFMFGVMGGCGIEFNLFNIVAGILIIGLGVDYGIFMVCRVSEGLNHATESAVFVSGLTTLAGFGVLVLARHPALHSIGITVLLGIIAAIPSALFVIPSLYGSK